MCHCKYLLCTISHEQLLFVVAYLSGSQCVLYAAHSKRIQLLDNKISILKRWIAEYEGLLEDSWNIKLFLNEHFVVD